MRLSASAGAGLDASAAMSSTGRAVASATGIVRLGLGHANTCRFCPFSLPTFYTRKDGTVRHYSALMTRHLQEKHPKEYLTRRRAAQLASSVPPSSPIPQEAL